MRSDDPRLRLGTGTAVSSPFVIAAQDAGIAALPSIINACLLTSAWSAASSDLYTSSRALYGLALNGNAPRVLARVNGYGLPWVAVTVCILFSFLSFMSAANGKAGEAFGWFANMVRLHCRCVGLETDKLEFLSLLVPVFVTPPPSFLPLSFLLPPLQTSVCGLLTWAGINVRGLVVSD